jgi:hypothetical protein
MMPQSHENTKVHKEIFKDFTLSFVYLRALASWWQFSSTFYLKFKQSV